MLKKYFSELKEIRVFLIFWLSQVISQIGSQLTSFALGVWVYQKSGSVTDFALIAMFATLPGVLLAPFLGTLVDRWDRRKAIMLSDAGSALCTLFVTILYFFGRLEVGHIYITAAIGSTLGIIQHPAMAASIPLLVPKEKLGNVNGMVQFGQSVALLLGPALAGVLVLTIKVYGVILIDFCTFGIAILTLLFLVRIPAPKASEDKRANEGSIFKQAAYGLTYLNERPGLRGLFFLFMATNFAAAITFVLITPLALTFTNAAGLGFIVSVGGVGMLVGSFIMSLWGGPKKKINGVYIFIFVEGLAFILAGFQPLALVFAAGIFCYNCALMLDDGCYVTIFQKKIAQDVQGRLFALNHMVTKGSMPVAYLISGFAADKIFEPLFQPGGLLAGNLGMIIGVGKGRGMGFMYILAGIMTILVIFVAYLYPRIKHIETELPDIIPDKPEGSVSITDNTVGKPAELNI